MSLTFIWQAGRMLRNKLLCDTSAGLDRRADWRESLVLTTLLLLPARRQLEPARVRNLSATGMMVECEMAPEAGTRIKAQLRGIGPVEGTVIWRKRYVFGVKFDCLVDPKLTRRRMAGGGTQLESARPSDPGR